MNGITMGNLSYSPIIHSSIHQLSLPEEPEESIFVEAEQIPVVQLFF